MFTWHLLNSYWGLSKSQNTGRDLIILLANSSSCVRDENLVLLVSVGLNERESFSVVHYLRDLHQFSLYDLNFDRITSRESLIILV